MDNRRSHIPENKCSKSQQKWWAEQEDRKSQARTARTRVRPMVSCFSGEIKRMRGREGSGGPGGPHTRPGRGQGVPHAYTWRGGVVGPSELPQVPLCLILRVKIIANFLEFFGKLYKKTISRICIMIQSQENNYWR